MVRAAVHATLSVLEMQSCSCRADSKLSFSCMLAGRHGVGGVHSMLPQSELQCCLMQSRLDADSISC